MPDWDQWDAEAVETLIPWFTHDHFLTHLFTPHNEHRVVLTKLQALALVLLNGQWDARLEAVTNAALHAALAAAFWLLTLRVLTAASSEQRIASSEHHAVESPRSSTHYPLLATRYFLPPALFLLTLALFALPLAWQNVLGGFHSQQYWLVGLSFATIVTLPFVRSFSPAWWIGAVSSFLALGSMGSGFLAAVAVVIVIVFRLFHRDTSLRASWPALTLAAGATALGILTRTEVAWHADMKAKTLYDFVFTIVHSLQWPWRDHDWAALVLWLPWLLLAVQIVRSPASPTLPLSPSSASAAPQTILALGGWVLLQLAATAYARGIGADYPASRYMDTLILGVLANALALAWLLSQTETKDRRPETRDPEPPSSRSLVSDPRSLVSSHWSLVSRGLLTCAWLLTLTIGATLFLTRIVRWELEGAKEYYVKAEGHMRRYLATNNPQHLAYPDIPFPNADGLAERLAQPSIRALMPVPLRTPLTLAAAPASPSDSRPDFLANNAVGAPIDRPPREGLSPATPPLDYTVTWGSYSTAADPMHAAHWRSAPVVAPLGGWLKFETAGDLGRPGARVSLQLLDAETGAHLADIRPSRPPGDNWRSAYVRAPRRPFVIAAADTSAQHWLAFSPPVEMGPLSFYAWQATRHAWIIFYSAAGLTALLAFLALRARRHHATSDEPDAPTAARRSNATA